MSVQARTYDGVLPSGIRYLIAATGLHFRERYIAFDGRLRVFLW